MLYDLIFVPYFIVSDFFACVFGGILLIAAVFGAGPVMLNLLGLTVIPIFLLVVFIKYFFCRRYKSARSLLYGTIASVMMMFCWFGILDNAVIGVLYTVSSILCIFAFLVVSRTISNENSDRKDNFIERTFESSDKERPKEIEL